MVKREGFAEGGAGFFLPINVRYRCAKHNNEHLQAETDDPTRPGLPAGISLLLLKDYGETLYSVGLEACHLAYIMLIWLAPGSVWTQTCSPHSGRAGGCKCRSTTRTRITILLYCWTGRALRNRPASTIHNSSSMPTMPRLRLSKKR